jgi:hypothetical protein
VAGNGTVDATRSKGITQANMDADTIVGTFCLTGLSFAPKSVMVMAATPFPGQEDTEATADTAPGGAIGAGDCSGTVLVKIREDGIGLIDSPFFVWLHD